ncbi:hypothetical protein DAI22_02g000300 [Oryza sativa Japonica Group]|jgi:hypothetical protein|nr:hypothetical protein DAI22_02g000300 [Oryza sativa Japonica Group]
MKHVICSIIFLVNEPLVILGLCIHKRNNSPMRPNNRMLAPCEERVLGELLWDRLQLAIQPVSQTLNKC